VEYIETTYACLHDPTFFATCAVSKGQGRWYFSHFTAERCRRGIRKWISLKYALGERRGALTIKSAFPRALSWSVGPQTCLLLLLLLLLLLDAAVPGVGWPSLSFWVMEETLCLGPYLMDRHSLRVSDDLFLMKWLVCGGNLLIGFLSGFLNMSPTKRSWRWCIVKRRRKGRSWPTWLKTLSLQTKSSCRSIMP